MEERRVAGATDSPELNGQLTARIGSTGPGLRTDCAEWPRGMSSRFLSRRTPIASELTGQPGYEVFPHSRIACRAGTKADAVVFHAQVQSLAVSFKGDANAARPAIGKRVLDRIRNKLVDDYTQRRCLIHAQWKRVGFAFDRNRSTARR